MKIIKLLFVEDDKALAYVIKVSLNITKRYEVVTACNGEEGLELFHSFKPDVIVADIIMPIMTGLEMVKEIRKHNKRIPIILATGQKKEQKDIIEGLSLGVDNYIQKDYEPEVLDKYIQALFRNEPEQTDEPCNIGNFVFDKSKKYLKYNDTISKLTTREANVLWMLWNEKGQLVKRKDILDKLWGDDKQNESRCLDLIVCKLRKKLHIDPSIQLITHRSEGFRLVVD